MSRGHAAKYRTHAQQEMQQISGISREFLIELLEKQLADDRERSLKALNQNVDYSNRALEELNVVGKDLDVSLQ